ncbi:MAG: putative signal peptide protein [Pseudomonadota bacterium]|jgi:hypothetical protein
MRTSHSLFCISLAAILPHLASATDLPKRKSGLWETTVSMSKGGQAQTMKECVDEASDAEMMKMATDTSKSMGGACSKNDFKRTATGFESESECALGGSKFHSKGSFTGDFSTAYTGSVTTTITPPMFGDPTSKTTITAKYLGPCSGDMQPGDVILANGMKMNMKNAAADAQEMAKKLANHAPSQGGAIKGMDMAKAMAAAQAELDPEDLQAMQEAMKELGTMGK